MYMHKLQQTRVVFVDRTVVVKRAWDVNMVLSDGSVAVGTVGDLECRGDLQAYLIAACEFELWAKSPVQVRMQRAAGVFDASETDDLVRSALLAADTQLSLTAIQSVTGV